jgi:hypothetical protein
LTLIDIWNPELHIFQMRHFEMMITLQEVQYLCQMKKRWQLLSFEPRVSYETLICQLIDCGLNDGMKTFVDKTGLIPLLNLQSLEKMIPNRESRLGDT